jgi:List-Bact-rpt repeat protein
MRKPWTLVLVVAAMLVVAGVAYGARPLDDEPPTATSTSPLETGTVLKVVIAGQGNVRGSGFNCTATCTHDLKKGDPITLTAQGLGGYDFSAWQGACGRAPQSTTCSFSAGDVTVVKAVFVQRPPAAVATAPSIGAIQTIQPAWVKVLSATPGIGVKDGRTTRKIDVKFDVGGTSVVRYELRQNGIVLHTWTSSPFSGRSTRTIWIDNRYAAGAYELGLRVTTGTQVKSFHGQVVLPAPQ